MTKKRPVPGPVGAEPVSPRIGALCAGALALLFLVQVAWGSRDKSLTWDEPGYIAAGYVNWRWGDHRLNADHPPLMQKLQGLPLLFMDIRAPEPGDARYLDSANPRASYGRDLVFSSGNDLAQITRWSRAPVMFLGVMLILCIYAWGRELLGPAPALLATALASLSPNLIAHSKLATEDLGCTAFVFAAVFAYWRAVREPSPARSVICGVVTGLALLSKYTALLLLPIYLLLAALLWRRQRLLPRALLGHLAVVAGVATGVVGLGYGLAFRPDLFVSGVFRVYPDVDPSYRFYFWGEVSENPRWYHALVSLGVKTPLPTLGLLGLAAARVLRSRPMSDALAFLLIPPAVVIAASFFDATNPGVRRILPAIPFLLLFAGFAIEGAATRLRVGAVVALVAWCGVEAALIHPHHLSYLNRAFGGPERGPYLFDESNIDWGQDLPALARWQRENLPDEAVHLLYFGSALPAAYGVRAAALDLSRLHDPAPGTYAVSSHYLGYFRKLVRETGADADWLTRYEPVARAGHSIWIYQVPGSGRSGAGPRPSR